MVGAGAVRLQPLDPRGPGHRAGRAEWRRQDTLLNLAVGMLRPTTGHRGLWWATGRRCTQLAKVGFVAQDTPTYAGLSIRDHLTFWCAPQPRLG